MPTGRNGRKNCLVIGKIKEVMSKVASKLLVIGPGVSITHRAKTLMIARSRY